MPVSISASIMQATAFVTSVMAYFVKDEKLTVFEIIVIILGLFGCLMLTNTDLFIQDDISDQRNNSDLIKYPYYYLGFFFSVLFTILNALKIMAMSELGNTVHSSLKTYWFGTFSTISATLFLTFYDPAIFQIWNIGTDQYPMNSD
jgi:drug/metabolite transporter (DMT)-like permease